MQILIDIRYMEVMYLWALIDDTIESLFLTTTSQDKTNNFG